MTIPISRTKYTSQNIDNMSFDEELGVRVTEIVGADGDLKNPASQETLLMVQYLTSLITRDQAQNTDGSKKVTIQNAINLLGFQLPSASTNVNIWGFVQDQSRTSVALNVINNIK